MICAICGQKSGKLTRHIKQHNITPIEYYNKYLKLDSEGVCAVCGNPTKFINISRGYNKYCCSACSNRDPKLKEQRFSKARKTCLEKYGGPAPICSVEVKEKIKQTCLKKYHTSWMGRNHNYHHIDKFFDSKDEKYLYDLFVSIYGYNNVCVHNYSDFLEKEIDFIIIDKKCADWNKVLYIEYHGWYGHGPEPYNPANPNHQKIITQWQAKGFTSFIKLWTYSDPKTLENAKWFNLRYKAIYKNELKAIKSNKHFRDQFIKDLKKL